MAEVEAAAEEGVVEAPTTTPAAVPQQAANPNIGAQNTPIYHQGSGKGAVCTSNGGGGHFSVVSPPPAPGRMFLLLNQQNETGTSPRNLSRTKTTVRFYKSYYILTNNCRKYIR